MLSRRTVLALTLAGMLTTSSCTSSATNGPGAAAVGATSTPRPTVSSAAGASSGTPSASATASPSDGASGSPSASAGTSAPSGDTKAVARAVHADELGQVPVLMYHQIIKDPGTNRYDETPAAFRAELARLQKDGFVPVTAAEYVAGRLDIPAGKHAVVLTFDDSTNSQFELGTDGKPLPDTAVGILQAFTAAHPDFPAKATFFANNGAFSGTPDALKWLHDNGFEVAVHTVSHANLGLLTDTQVAKEIGDNFQMIAAAIGEAPTTFALPYGMHPKNRELATKGTYKGRPYSLAGVFLVGANPAASPFAKRFDAANIPRIRSQHTKGGPNDEPYESKAILGDLKKHPTKLFTSDGDAATLSYPKSSAQYLGAVPAGMTRNAY
ncbi:MAG: xylanase [Frankiales bacterium]|nr:xylanase [Frankiales bacterium]